MQGMFFAAQLRFPLLQTVYQMSPFPWTTISELREKYTYDIHPFSTFNGNKKSDKKHPQKHGESALY